MDLQALNNAAGIMSGLGTLASGGTTTSSISSYASDGDDTRLTGLTGSDADGDLKRIAYMKLVAEDGAFNDIPEDANLDKATLDAILTEIKSKYQKFIITAIGINSQEKVQIMPTFGDAFAATFTGREPLILGITGYLVFDYASSGLQSWFHAFLNAYDYYLRGSRLAKWRAKMTFTLPDTIEYKGYMMNLNTQLASDNDTIMQFQFSFLVTDQTIFKSTLEPAVSTSTRSEAASNGVVYSGASVDRALNPAPNYANTGLSVAANLDNVIPAAGIVASATTNTTSMTSRVLGSTLTGNLDALKTNILKTAVPTINRALGSIDPAKILSADRQNAFKTSASTIAKQMSSVLPNSVTSGFSILNSKLDSFLLENSGKPINGSLRINSKYAAEGLLGEQNIAVGKNTINKVTLTQIGRRL